MMTDSFIRDLLGPVKGNLRHFIEWREENWERIRDDPQTHEDLSIMYGLVAA